MNFFAKLSIAKKLGFGFSLLLAILFSTGLFSLKKMDQINALSTEMAVNWLPSVRYASEINTQTSDFRATELQHILSTSEHEMTAYEAEMKSISDRMAESQKRYEKLISLDEERVKYEKLKETWAQYMNENQKVIALSRSNKTEEARDLIRGESKKRFDEFSAIIESIVEMNVKGGQAASDAGDVMYAETLKLVWALILGAVALGAAIAFSTTRSITKPLSKVMTEMGMGAQEVTTASEQLSQSSQELSSSASESAASLEETVSSLEELNSIVSTNANHAEEASKLSSQCVADASKGEASIADLNEAMGEIAKSSKRIEEIINVIEDIAFQTNLLALNAAVEAARAGEQGKGFAVVAEAVRNLAQKSAEAAKDITNLIQESGGKTERGARLAVENQKALSQIVQSITKVSDLNKEISVASQEQSRGLTQISQAMNQMDQSTQTNAATAEESAAASEEMASQATLLSQLVVDLKSVIQGAGSDGGHEIAQVVSIHSKRNSAKSKKTQFASANPKKDLESILPLEEDNKGRGKIGNVSGF